MKFFIKSVYVNPKFAKTNKGFAIQKVFENFRHVVLADDKALKGYYANIHRLVETCNRKYRGSEIAATYSAQKDSGRIAIYQHLASSLDAVAYIDYGIVADILDHIDVRQSVAELIRTFVGDIYEDFKVKTVVYDTEKGGQA